MFLVLWYLVSCQLQIVFVSVIYFILHLLKSDKTIPVHVRLLPEMFFSGEVERRFVFQVLYKHVMRYGKLKRFNNLRLERMVAVL